MRPRPAAVVALLAAAILLSGCSGDDVIDVPSSAEAVAPATPPSDPASPAPARPALDCERVLPASAVESGIGLPAGTVSPGVFAAPTPEEQDCSYSIAGNPSAVVVALRPARLAETFQGAGEAVGAAPAPLGVDAYWVEGDPATARPSELAVLAGGYELHLVSHVGDQGLLTDWAVSALDAVGVALAVA